MISLKSQGVEYRNCGNISHKLKNKSTELRNALNYSQTIKIQTFNQRDPTLLAK